VALLKLEGEIIIATATALGTFGGFVITIPVGRYFLSSIGSGGATRSLCDEIEFQMETMMGAGASSVTLDDDTDAATGKVTIARSGAFAITWTSTALRNALGFTGNLGAATSHLAPNHAKYLFLSNVGRAGLMAPSASTGALETDQTISIAPDGTCYSLAYSVRTLDSLDFRHLRGKKAWVALESSTNESLERFFRDTLALRIRFHADRAVDATFRTWVIEDATRYAPTAFDERWVEGAETLWSIRFVVREVS
jgi:hypothetical protein